MTSKFDSDPRGISSSPSMSAPRSNRSAWLSRAGSSASIKYVVAILAVVLLTAAALVSVPFVLRRFQSKSASNKIPSYHNHVANSTGKY